MKHRGDLASAAPVGLGAAPAAEAERLVVDLLAGAGCVGVAILIFHRVVGAAGVLPLVGSRGPYAFLAAGAAAVAIGFAAAWDFLLYRGWVFRASAAGSPAGR